MLVYSIIAVAVILFVLGAYFFIKGFSKKTKDESEIIPISDLEEINEMKKNFVSGEQEYPGLKRDDVDLSEHLINDNLKKDALSSCCDEDSSSEVIEKYQSDIEVYKDSINSLHIKIDDLSSKNKKLEDAIERELSVKDTTTLSKEELEMLKENEKKAERDQVALDNLTKDGMKANSLISEQKEKINQMEESIEKYKLMNEMIDGLRRRNEEADALNLQYAQKISFLEKSSEQLKELMELREHLLEKSQKDDAVIKAQKEKIDDLEGQKTYVKKSLDEYKSSIKNREAQLQKDKFDFDEKQNQIMDKMKNMKMVRNENEGLKESLCSLESELASLKDEYEKKSKCADLKAEHLDKGKEELFRNILELELSFNKLKEYNSYLLTKEKVLQYELTKNRAKALGFEKICEDFKVRIDNAEKPDAVEGVFS